MITLARPYSEQASHYYWPSGEPAYEVENKSVGGMRPTTVRDARKLGLLPSVTTILSTLRKSGLELWKIENACLAVLTTPRQVGEELDAFVKRVLHTERVQDEESRKARELGTAVHDSMERLFRGDSTTPHIEWVWDAYYAIRKPEAHRLTEFVTVGDGYAGKVDLGQTFDDRIEIWDFKTCKEIPDKPWPEHVLQLSAYAAALARTTDKPILTANCYISTTQKGQFKIHRHEQDWCETYENGFKPLVQHWCWANRMPASQFRASITIDRPEFLSPLER